MCASRTITSNIESNDRTLVNLAEDIDKILWDTANLRTWSTILEMPNPILGISLPSLNVNDPPGMASKRIGIARGRDWKWDLIYEGKWGIRSDESIRMTTFWRRTEIMRNCTVESLTQKQKKIKNLILVEKTIIRI